MSIDHSSTALDPSSTALAVIDHQHAERGSGSSGYYSMLSAGMSADPMRSHVADRAAPTKMSLTVQSV